MDSSFHIYPNFIQKICLLCLLDAQWNLVDFRLVLALILIIPSESTFFLFSWILKILSSKSASIIFIHRWLFKKQLIEIEFIYKKIFDLFKAYASIIFSIFRELGNHHHDLSLEYIITSKRNLIPNSSQSPFCTSSPIQPLIYLLSLQSCFFWTFHVHWVTQDAMFWDLLLSLSITF